MGQILYIPGFQEAHNFKMPGKVIEAESEKRGIDFTRISLPGDSDNPDELSHFNLTSVQQAIEDAFSLASYSLSAIPTISASKKYSERVSKILLIHPALDVVHAVKVMDWLKRKDLNIPLERRNFTHGDPDIVFNTLIGGWRGDALQFQDDLKHTPIISRAELPGNALVHDYDYDRITKDTDNSSYAVAGRKRVMMSHIPKFQNPDILENFFES